MNRKTFVPLILFLTLVAGAALGWMVKGEIKTEPPSNADGIPASPEGTETVNLQLSGRHSGYTISGPTASINIYDNEVPPVVWISGDNDAKEGGATGVFTVHRSSSVDALVVYYSAPTGTAINGTDYSGAAANGGSVSFINGETTKLVTITAVDDLLVEGEELVTMTLVNGNGYTINTGRASVNIDDNDQPDFVITQWQTIYDANLTGQSIYDIHPGEPDGAFFAGEKAPTSTVNTMEDIADKLVAVLGSKEKANIELKARAKPVKDSKVVLFRDVDELKSDALKAKNRYIQVVTAAATSGERTAGYFMWGQTIDLPKYTGTVIQQIEYTDTIHIVGAAKPRVDKTQILVEGVTVHRIFEIALNVPSSLQSARTCVQKWPFMSSSVST